MSKRDSGYRGYAGGGFSRRRGERLNAEAVRETLIRQIRGSDVTHEVLYAMREHHCSLYTRQQKLAEDLFLAPGEGGDG